MKGIDQVQWFIEGLAGSVKRVMTNKFQTYEKAKKQASHIVEYRNSSTESARKGAMCHGVAGMHARELQRHACWPNDGVKQTSSVTAKV